MRIDACEKLENGLSDLQRLSRSAAISHEFTVYICVFDVQSYFFHINLCDLQK